MTVEPLSYRIDCAAHDAYDGSYTGGLPDPISFLVDDGVLVPDTRLQAIAEAWVEYTDAVKDGRMAHQEWLEVQRLLDALTKEDSE